MAIEELERRMYRKGETFADREGDRGLSRHAIRTPGYWGGDSGDDEQMKKPFLKKSTILIIVGAALFLIAGFSWLFFRSGFLPSALLDLRVILPADVASGDVTTFEVAYKNSGESSLRGVELVIDLPEYGREVANESMMGNGASTIRKAIGDVSPGVEGKETFRVVVFGNVGETVSGKVRVEYRPEGSSARFVKEESYESRISHSELGLSLDMPSELQEGQQVTLKARILSSSDIAFKNLSLGIVYPNGFVFEGADESPVEADNVWGVADLMQSVERVITIRGHMKEDIHDAQVFTGQLGLYDRTKRSWTMFARAEQEVIVRTPFLFVDATINERDERVVAPGEEIAVTIFWQNNLPVAVRNVNLETEISGTALDYRSIISSDGGSYDGTTKRIRWTPARYPTFSLIEPGGSGRVRFRLRVLSALPISGEETKNFTVSFRSSIAAENVPQGFEGVDIRGRSLATVSIGTNVGFAQRGYYYTSPVPNSGGLPPRVGKETLYTIVWSVTTESNDIRGVTVRAALPTYVRWKGVVAPLGEDMSFDAVRGEVTWRVPDVPAGTGRLRPPKEIAFQIGLIPSDAQIGESPELISSASFTASDPFINASITRTSRAVTAVLPDDPKVEINEKKVAR